MLNKETNSVRKWYQLAADVTIRQLDSNAQHGLTDTEVAARLKTYGRNELQASKKLNPFKLFLSQFQDALIIILLIAAAVSFGLAFVEEGGSTKESILIVTIVIAIALVGFFNEYKAEKTVEALRQLVGFKARVRRDGKVSEVDAAELVPGDIVVLEAGQKIPADIRLIEVMELQVNEASLTGESLPVPPQP